MTGDGAPLTFTEWFLAGGTLPSAGSATVAGSVREHWVPMPHHAERRRRGTLFRSLLQDNLPKLFNSQKRGRCPGFCTKESSNVLDTHTHEEQYQFEASLFEAKLPLLSPFEVFLKDKLRIERQLGRTY